jgi:cell division transport system permease protein
LKDSISDNIIQQKIKLYSSHPYIKKIQYIPADTAWVQFKNEIGEDLIDVLGQNPLPASIEIQVKPAYATTEHMLSLKKTLEKDDAFVSVYLQEKALDEIEKNSQYIQYFFYALELVVALIVIAIIYNSIRLLIYSKRFIIRTMLLVGAKRNFIYRPYVLLSLWTSFIASIIAALFLQITFQFILRQFPDLQLIYQPMDFLYIFGLIVGSGIIVTLISTYISLRHYIRLDIDRLYS